MTVDDTEGSATDHAPPPGAGKSKRRRKPHLIRRITCWILVVLASLLIPLSVMSFWAIRTVTDTDHYVATMAPLARNDVIVHRLAEKATDALFSSHVVQDKLTQILPAKAKPIVNPLLSQLHGYVYGLALKVFESPKFGQLWDALNRHTHTAVVDILTGQTSKESSLVKKAGAVAINVSPALQNLIKEADAKGVTLFNPLKSVLSQHNSLSFTIVSTKQVSKFSRLFNLLVQLRWEIPVAALVLAVGAVGVAVERRKTLARIAVGVGAFTLVLLAALAVARQTFLHEATKANLDTAAAAAVWDTVLRYLKSDLRWLLLLAVVGGLVAWLAGPSRYAVWTRSKAVQGGHWVGSGAKVLTGKKGEGDVPAPAGAWGKWVLEHAQGLRIAGAVLAGLCVLVGVNLSDGVALAVAIALVVYLGVIQVIVVWARRTAPDAPSPPAA
jgi:hypothetical protein